MNWWYRVLKTFWFTIVLVGVMVFAYFMAEEEYISAVLTLLASYVSMEQSIKYQRLLNNTKRW